MSELTEFEKFVKCTKVKQSKNRVTVDCVKGLWGVDAPTMEQAIDEAKSYFLQYLGDGEYSDIVGGKDPLETMLEEFNNT